MIEGNVAFTLGRTFFACLPTGIGSALAFFSKKMDVCFLAGMLVMAVGLLLFV